MSENEGEVFSDAVEVAAGVCFHKVEGCHLIVCGSHIADDGQSLSIVLVML